VKQNLENLIMAAITYAQKYGKVYEAMAVHVKTINSTTDVQAYSELFLDAVKNLNSAFLKAAFLREAKALPDYIDQVHDYLELPQYDAMFAELHDFEKNLKNHKLGYIHYHREKAETVVQKVNNWTPAKTPDENKAPALTAAQTAPQPPKKPRMPLTPLNYFNATIAKK